MIEILRYLIYLHTYAYDLIFLTRDNITNYIRIPDYFDLLHPAHQSDYVRVNVICEYGGIYLDSDTLIIESIDSLFEMIEKYDGFFISIDSTFKYYLNGIFGSKPNTKILIEWKNRINDILDVKKQNIAWEDIGNVIITNLILKNNHNYKLIDGSDTIYPVNWKECYRQYCKFSYKNHHKLTRTYQPLLIFTNDIYKLNEDKTIEEIFTMNNSLKYFLNKSLSNIKILNKCSYSRSIDLESLKIDKSIINLINKLIIK